MNTLLQLNSSLFGDGGASSALTAAFTARWREANPAGTVIERDLAKHPVPHLTAEAFAAFGGNGEPSVAGAAALRLSNELIDELRRADVVALGLPMYNFAVPSTLKAYFDHVARAGVTFRYGASGPEGLLRGKKAVILTARGGVYAEESETAWVRQILRFLGITDVEIVVAEGLAIEGRREGALASAKREVDRLSETARHAA